MGCGPSRASSLSNIDDSRHVMQNRDIKVKQKEGQGTAPPAFKPRAENLKLKPKSISTNTNTNTNTNPDANPAVAAPSSTTKTVVNDIDSSDSKDD
jgi:hypothetical protein